MLRPLFKFITMRAFVPLVLEHRNFFKKKNKKHQPSLFPRHSRRTSPLLHRLSSTHDDVSNFGLDPVWVKSRPTCAGSGPTHDHVYHCWFLPCSRSNLPLLVSALFTIILTTVGFYPVHDQIDHCWFLPSWAMIRFTTVGFCLIHDQVYHCWFLPYSWSSWSWLVSAPFMIKFIIVDFCLILDQVYHCWCSSYLWSSLPL